MPINSPPDPTLSACPRRRLCCRALSSVGWPQRLALSSVIVIVAPAGRLRILPTRPQRASTSPATPHRQARSNVDCEAAGGASAPLIRAETACRTFLPAPPDQSPRLR
ncbi:hypothetical protein P171DRAFT_479990 [Karstenula rhodostoma CBS 690.94]|uniref:Uncharacterized protein n=1 Tax=Karstenula rhodostoma CBS 690.94 TaxID=1392251 RepID=A0A9P4UIS4_9PLEO|nr:hypothetical protein P171DRAFT_479990 [Karstenula rhodostoma CBS 690.94]